MFARVLISAIFVALFTFAYGAPDDNKSAFDKFNEERQKRFDEFNNERQTRFDEFRRQRNEEFAKFLAQPWQEKATVTIEPKREDPAPLPPTPITEDDTTPLPEPGPEPIIEIIKIDPPKPQPKPIEPIVEVSPYIATSPTVQFMFYGTPLKVRIDKNKAYKLKGVKEADISKAWLELSTDQYTNLVHDCLNIRENLDLCDWAYLQMLEKMADAVCGSGTNESVLLMAYVFCQSGYKMRLAEKEGKLCMFYASDHMIRNTSYLPKFDGDDFYLYGKLSPGSLRIQNCKYPAEQSMSLVIDKWPKFTLNTDAPVSHKSKRYDDTRITVTANKNMLDFYGSYPPSSIGSNLVTQWGILANAPMPENIKAQLYPQLRKAISGCDEATAVNKLLNLIQTGFEYGYDDKIWGGERMFFPEETLHYPYCDCEDRGILLSRLVRDILGLDCLLVHYPMHIATAVALTDQDFKGDYITYEGRKFFIADPTITGIGAPVGVTMRNKDNKTAKVLLLDRR